MPDDYQAILDDLGVDTSAGAGANTNTNTDPVNPNTQDDGTTANEPVTNTGDNNNAQATGDSGAVINDPAQNNNQANATNNTPDNSNRRQQEAFAAMRSENSKYKKFVQQIMKGAGFDGDEAKFMEQLTEASYRQQAQRQGNQVSPELLKRMDAIENQNRTLIDAQNKQLFTSNLKNLQDTLKLDDKDIKEFVELAVRESIDLTIPGTNFVTLYQGLFFDKLKDRMIEEERQKWITQNSKANNAANPDGQSGKKDPAKTNVNTMAEFDSLLQSIPKK